MQTKGVAASLSMTGQELESPICALATRKKAEQSEY